ncbi:hypothetical protein ACLK1Z_06515 [Escherichia coli]
MTPITGNNYELGLKSDWMNSRLTTTLAIFRIEQDKSLSPPVHLSPAATAKPPIKRWMGQSVRCGI